MALARSVPGIEIISMDSAMVYRGMDIGTAKPSKAEQAEVPHHVIDLIDPTASYSAASFIRDAVKAKEDIERRGKIPLMIGGTMMYYQAYRQGLDDLPSAPQALRDQIAQEAAAIGWPALHQQLEQLDPITAKRLEPSDRQRISRALELYAFTGKTMSQLIAESPPEARVERRLVTLALMPEDRTLLHAGIERRFHQMIKDGFLEEAEHLKNRGDLKPDMPSMRCVGYRQAWRYLDGLCSKDDFIAQGIAASRQLAKRQITWMRGFDQLSLVDPFGQGIDMKALTKTAAALLETH